MSHAITTLILTGMRIGELLTLQWKYVDFKSKTITIQQSLTRKLVFDEAGKTEKMVDALGATKTRTSRRGIQAPDLILTQLREWMRYEVALKGGLKVLVPEGFIFISTRTMGMRTDLGFRASYRRFLERNGFEAEDLTLHRFCHTYTSMLLEQEINPKIVQKLLGHQDIGTTLGGYIHVVPEVLSGVMIAVNDALEKLLTGTYTPKMNEARGRDQIRQLAPLISEDTEVKVNSTLKKAHTASYSYRPKATQYFATQGGGNARDRRTGKAGIKNWNPPQCNDYKGFQLERANTYEETIFGFTPITKPQSSEAVVV